jgi:hypothetical protein
MSETTTTTPAEAQENEATSEEYNTFELAGVALRVKPMGQWRPSYLRALRTADFEGWAAGALHEDDAVKFVEADATFDEIGEFTKQLMEDSGEAPGKSGARSARAKTTRKR